MAVGGYGVGHQRARVRLAARGSGVLVGIGAAVVLAAAARRARRCGCAPTTSPSSPSPPARSSASTIMAPPVPRRHRRVRRHCRASTTTSQPQPVQPAATTGSGSSSSARPGTWVISSAGRWCCWRCCGLAADPQPVGPGPEGHPRGRGRGAGLGKNVFGYKMQSLILGGVIGAFGGMFLAIGRDRSYPATSPRRRPSSPMSRLHPRRDGTHLGTGGRLDDLLGLIVVHRGAARRARRQRLHPEQPDERQPGRPGAPHAGGPRLMLLMIFRPQGIFGDRRELMLDER